MAEEYRKLAWVLGATNATFINFIIKVHHLIYFYDYHPIYLCNNIYKLISKTIANQVKQFLSKHILTEWFGIRENQQILEIVASTQECIHLVKNCDLDDCLMQIDLTKAFQCID